MTLYLRSVCVSITDLTLAQSAVRSCVMKRLPAITPSSLGRHANFFSEAYEKYHRSKPSSITPRRVQDQFVAHEVSSNGNQAAEANHGCHPHLIVGPLIETEHFSSHCLTSRICRSGPPTIKPNCVLTASTTACAAESIATPGHSGSSVV